MDVSYGAAEEAGAEALEFFDGVGGEAADLCRLVIVGGAAWFGAAVDEARGGFGGGFGGVDDLHAGGDGLFDERAQKGVVGAAEDERVWLEAGGCGVGCEFVEVDPDDFLR